MKYLLSKDQKKRQLFLIFEKKKLILKALSKDKRIIKSLRLFFKTKLNGFKKNTSKTRLNNRCIYSGRKRGIVRYFKMSRLEVRDNLLKGLLYGIRKSSW